MGVLNKWFGGLFDGFRKSSDNKVDEGFIEPVEQPIKELSADKKSLIDETDVMLNMIFNEFKLYPFKDKCKKYINSTNKAQLDYTFENGQVTQLIFTNDDKFDIIFYKNGKYIHYAITSKRLYKIINDISNFSDTCAERVKNKYKDIDPALKEKYNLIIRQIKLRQEEVNKLPKNDTKRAPLENELAAYKKAADRIKAQFKLA